MDAATKQFSRSSLLLSLALLIPASALAQTPTFILNGSGTSATITLFGNQGVSVTVQGTQDSAASPVPLNYSAATVYNDPDGVHWLCMFPNSSSCDNSNGLTTPDALSFQIGQNANSPSLTPSPHSATVTLTATNGSTATITVQYTPGSNSGNGGNTNNGLIAGPSSINQQSLTYGSTIPGSFQITSSSSSAVGFSVTADQNWIAITGVSFEQRIQRRSCHNLLSIEWGRAVPSRTEREHQHRVRSGQ